MKSIFSEKNLVVLLFVLVLVIFSLAQEDSRQLEKLNDTSHSGMKWRSLGHPSTAEAGSNSQSLPGAVQ